MREVNLRDTHSAIRENILSLQQAAYAVAFVEQATETETPLIAIYELVRGFLDCLCKHKPASQIIFAFELKLLRELGLEPDWSKTGLAAGTKKSVAALTQKDWASGLRLRLTKEQTVELRQFLHGFLIFHLGRLPRGRAAALADGS